MSLYVNLEQGCSGPWSHGIQPAGISRGQKNCQWKLCVAIFSPRPLLCSGIRAGSAPTHVWIGAVHAHPHHTSRSELGPSPLPVSPSRWIRLHCADPVYQIKTTGQVAGSGTVHPACGTMSLGTTDLEIRSWRTIVNFLIFVLFCF